MKKAKQGKDADKLNWPKLATPTEPPIRDKSVKATGVDYKKPTPKRNG